MDTTLVLAASLTYLLATIVYGAYLLHFDDRIVSVALATMGLGLALTLSAFGVRVAQGSFALGMYDAFLALAVIIAVFHLGTMLMKRAPLSGAFLSPILTMLTYSLHVFHRESGAELSAEVAIVTPIHIAASLGGFAIFGVSASAAMLSVLQEYRLKKKQISLIGGTRIPSLQTLEKVAHYTLIVGFPIYSVGMALGAVWFTQVATPSVTRHLIMASFSWVLYAFLIHARVTVGLRGRKAALLTLAAFASALFVVLLSALRMGAA